MNRKLKWVDSRVSGFLTAVFHPSAKTIFLASSEKSAIHCFDATKENFGKPEIFETGHTSGLWDLAISQNGNFIVTCGEDHLAHLFSFKSNKLTHQRLLDKSEDAIFSASFAYSNDLIATPFASDIKISPVHADLGGRPRLLSGHKGSILTVSFDPLREFLASFGSDGTFRVWKCDTNQEVGKLEIVTTTGKPTEKHNFCRSAWSPDGKFIAVPTFSNISISERPPRGEDWTVNFDLSDEDFTEAICVVWAPNSKFLVSGHSNGSAFLWDVETKETIERISCPGSISSLAWHPENNEVLIACVGGQFAIWPSILDQKKLKVTEKTKVQQYNDKQKGLESLIDDEAIESGGDSETEPSTENVDDMEGPGSSFIDDSEPLKVTKKRKLNKDEDKKQKSSEAKDSQGKGESRNEIHAPSFSLDSQYHYALESEKKASSRKMVESVDFIHKPFQVNSSHEADTKRYLLWNEVGKITNRYENGVSTIKVEFTSIDNKTLTLTKNMNVTHAALGASAFVLVSTNDDLSNTLLYHKFLDAWTQNTDWTIPMPKDEPVQIVAICNNHIAVSTSKYLRIFDSTGLQVDVIGKQHGHILTMVGYKDLLCVVKSETPQRYHFEIYRMGIECYVHKTASYFLSDGASNDEIAWVGFNDVGQVAVMDNTGTIQVLMERKKEAQSQWYPMLESSTASTYNGSFWIVKLDREKIIYVPIKTSTGAPAFVPPPVPNTMNLTIPLIPTPTAREEEDILRTRLTLQDDGALPEKFNYDKKLLKLFNSACKNDKYERALALVSNFKITKSLDVALQIAQSQNLSLLANRINAIKVQLEEQENANSEEESMQVETRPQFAPRTERPAIKPNITNKQVVNIPDDTPSASSEITESPSRSGSDLGRSGGGSSPKANMFPKAKQNVKRKSNDIMSLW